MKCLLSFAVGLASSLVAAAPSAAASSTDDERPWTFLIYGAADNNADGPILTFLDELRAAWKADPGIELLLFLDRSEEFSADATVLGEDFTGCRLYRLTKDGAERMAGGEEFPEIRLDQEVELDSADPRHIAQFLRWGRRVAPARRTALMIYGHASGTAMCPDDHSGTEMGIAQLPRVVPEELSVDFLALELCNMGGVEIAYEWRPGNGGFSAEVLLAIPNAGPPLDWARAFARLRTPTGEDAPENSIDPTTMDAEEFGALIVQEGEAGRRQMMADNPVHAHRIQREAAAAYDLYAVEDVKSAVDELAIALAEGEGREVFESLRGPGHRCCTMNYVGDQLTDRPFVDLYDLCRRASEEEGLDEGVRAAAKSVMEATEAMVLDSFGMDGLEDFAPGRNGVFIVFPDGAARDPQTVLGNNTMWRHLGWYTPRRLHGGPWVYGEWTWCADGATEGNGVVENWFELLDSWYDDPEDSTGGPNTYVH